MCRHRMFCIGLSLLLASFTGTSLAAAVDDSVKGAVRELSSQGKEDYDAGRYEQAAEKFRRAYATIQVPTLALWTARCLVNLGQLVSASELYRQATQLERNELWIGNTQQEARAEAAQELDEVLLRIAHLRIVVTGAAPNDVTATVDGVKVPNALLGVERPTDPGRRIVRGEFQGEAIKAEVELDEGQTKEIKLEFAAKGSSLAAGARTSGSSSAETRADTAGPGSVQRTLGYVGLGIGATGILVGTVAGILVANRYSDLESNCPNDVCDPARTEQSRLDSYNTLRTLSLIGFVVGGVGVAAGATLVLTSPADPHQVGLFVTPSTASIRGAF